MEELGRSEEQLIEKVVTINRTTKVLKGGRRFGFAAVVVVGDGQGCIGIEMGKALEVPDAIRKASAKARKHLMRVPRCGNTIPHEIMGRHGSTRVFMKPASPGTGIRAGGAARAVLEAAGIQDVLSKCYGSRNPQNVVKAVVDAMKNLEMPSDVAARRGKSLDEMSLDSVIRQESMNA